MNVWNGSEEKIPLESGPATVADDRVSAAEAALQVARRAGGDLRGALAEAATAYREADRRDEAIAAYRELATVLGGLVTADDQVRAAGSDMWVARLAQEADEDHIVRHHLTTATERCAALEQRWGSQPVCALIRLEAACRMGVLALRAGEVESAWEQLLRAVIAADPAVQEADLPSLAHAAIVAARILAANGLLGTAGNVLDALTGHAEASGDTLLAGQALEADGELEARFGDEPTAIRLLRRAGLAIGDQPDSPDAKARAGVLSQAGLCADRLGDYALARFLYQRALDHYAAVLPPGAVDVLMNRYNLAEIARVTGDNETVIRDLTEITDVLRGQGADAPPEFRCTALKNLGVALLDTGRLDRAQSVFTEALSVPGRPAARKAEIVFSRARARSRSQQGSVDMDEIRNAVAGVLAENGADSMPYLLARWSSAGFLPLDEAAAVYRSLLEKVAGADDHQSRDLRRRVLRSLGMLRWRQGDAVGMLESLRGALGEAEREHAETWRVRSAFEPGPAKRFDLERLLLTLVARRFRDQDEARRLAFRAAVGTKRLSAEMILAQNELILRGFTRLLPARDLAAALRRGWGATGAPTEDKQQQLDEVERQLSLAVPREVLLELLDHSTAEYVAAHLPTNVTLVEYVRCPGFDPPEDAGPSAIGGPAWYAAFVLPNGRPEEMALLDLGEAARIDEAAQMFWSAIADADLPEPQWRVYSRRLAELIWNPLLASLPADDMRVIAIAPDGALCRVPFDALIGADGLPLLATNRLSLLATGRDAGRGGSRANRRGTPPVVIAAPDYGTPQDTFMPLQETRAEGEAIADLLGVAAVTDGAATRDYLLSRADPEILHLATHGYYLPVPADGADRTARHPLLDSGIALAGANCGASGLVTALDVLGMGLAGTDLVVLSACESGLGPLDNEEGLMGVARSFLLSGARSVVWSLWRVDDVATARLMTLFYRRMLAGFARSVALRDSKMELYAEEPNRPDLWAGFVVQGDLDQLLRHRFVLPTEAQLYDRQVPSSQPVVTDLDPRLVPQFAVDAGQSPPIGFVSINLRNSQVAKAQEEFDLGQELLDGNRPEQAQPHFEKALTILRETPHHPALLEAMLYGRLAVVALVRGQGRAGRRMAKRAVAAFERIDVISLPFAIALDNLGLAEVVLARPRHGRRHLTRALAMKRVLLPPGDAQIAFTERALTQADAGFGHLRFRWGRE